MHRLSLLILFSCLCAGFGTALLGQSPHGEDFVMDCAACHTPEGWDISLKKWENDQAKRVSTNGASSILFDHDGTAFPLEGTHTSVDCRACHEGLIFDQADNACISCHLDIHVQSVGSDCARCHNVDSWLVDDIPELHEANGFPLVGPHDILSCVDCHISETNLRFDRLGNECISCHMDDYANTQNPNHIEVGYSTECLECHPPLSATWETDRIVHSFFPLIGGHDIQDCQQCHHTNNFSDASPDCFECHQDDYNNTNNPDHNAAQFPTDCAQCHNEIAWELATWNHDEMYFPIYSGNHKNEWNQCSECHTTANDYSLFSCIECHEHNDAADLADEHADEGVTDYVFESTACLACHPNGD